MAASKYTEIADQVRDLYIEGLSKKKIAKAMDVDQAQIAYILYVQLKVHETHPRRLSGAELLQYLPKEKINKIITLSSFGYTNTEIAMDQGMPASNVFKIVTEAKNKKLIKKVF